MHNKPKARPIDGLKSIEVIFAAVGLAAFWMSIPRFDQNSGGHEDGNNPKLDVVVVSRDLKPAKLLRQGKNIDAVAEAQRMVANKPRDPAVQLCAADVYLKIGGPDLTANGLSCLKTALAMVPKNKQVRIKYARALATANQVDKAIEQYDQLVTTYPDWFEPAMERAQLVFLYANANDAAKMFHEVALKHPSKPEALFQCGIALARAGEADDGLDEYMKGVEAEKSVDKPQALKAILMTWGSLEKAKYDLEKRAEGGADAMTLMRLAEVNLYLDDLSDARQWLLAAKKMSQNNWEIKRCLAVVYYKMGNRKQASQEFGQSVQLERKQLEDAKKRRNPFADR